MFFFSFHDQIMGPTLQLATCSIKYRSNTRPRPVCTAAVCLWLWLKMKPKVALTSSLCDPVDARTLLFRFTFFLQYKLSLSTLFVLSTKNSWVRLTCGLSLSARLFHVLSAGSILCQCCCYAPRGGLERSLLVLNTHQLTVYSVCWPQQLKT